MLRAFAVPALAGLVSLVLASTSRADNLDGAIDLINRHLAQFSPVTISIQRTTSQPMPGRVMLEALTISDGRTSFSVPGPIVVGEVTAGPVKRQGELELAAGTFHIKEMFLQRFAHADHRTSLTIDAIGLSDVIVPPLGSTDPFQLAQMLGTLTTGQIRVDQEGGTPLLVDGIVAATHFRPERGTLQPDSVIISANVNGLALTAAMIRELDLDDLFGPLEPQLRDRRVNAALPMIWDVAAGTLSLGGARLEVPGYATMTALFEIKGLSRQLVDEAVAEAKIALGLLPPANPPQPAQAFLMRSMASLGLSVASVELQNEALVQIVLAQIAFQAKMDPQRLKAEIASQLERMLTAAGMPAFSTQVAEAARLFLDNPGTLRVTARPKDMALLLQIAAFAAYPEQLVNFLNVSIDALPPG